tara:strand:+ start:28560 stop:29570 length:1011 start_codon:yes stop_codon:yes gene_type:complete
MKIAFHSYQLGDRGTEVCLYKYAKYNREILGNESIIISTNTRPIPTHERFAAEFETILYPHVWSNEGVDGCNDDLKKHLESIVDEKNIDAFYAIKGGESDYFMPSNCKTLAHCIFRCDEPHGDVYAGVCKYIVDKFGGKHPYVDHIIEKPDVTTNLRNEVGIPKDAFVIGRHGGYHQFSIPFVKYAIAETLSRRSDVYFLFLNTEKFVEHERAIFIPWTGDLSRIAQFCRSCDAMIHARLDGEIFPLTVAEMSIQNKPIITWDGIIETPDRIGGYDRGHIDLLGPNGLYYKNIDDLFTILMNIKKSDIEGHDWDVYKDTYSPENVMKQFDEVFLKG